MKIMLLALDEAGRQTQWNGQLYFNIISVIWRWPNFASSLHCISISVELHVTIAWPITVDDYI